MPLISNRRRFITGLVLFVAAPAIVRVSSLMSVKQFVSSDRLDLIDLIFRTDPTETPFMIMVDRIDPLVPFLFRAETVQRQEIIV